MDGNATQPNAYRIEAEEKRKLASQYAAEANELDAQADLLEHPEKSENPEVPKVETKPDEAEQPSQDKKKLFSK